MEIVGFSREIHLIELFRWPQLTKLLKSMAIPQFATVLFVKNKIMLFRLFGIQWVRLTLIDPKQPIEIDKSRVAVLVSVRTGKSLCNEFGTGTLHYKMGRFNNVWDI